ncbi:prolyl oligopeptidase family serine peptidase [Steroidobacter sp.]|uniref:S9 family peptidase n=1 Tax=Steroidobacter sp. TaxID=1978227 RepID=UPI001A593D3E|nr:prolyl oligopeptidase family serine peptidase [Steroidobacter sp.]MBL8267711.1 S9 family peptidase [Steroidobacter sp.]
MSSFRVQAARWGAVAILGSLVATSVGAAATPSALPASAVVSELDTDMFSGLQTSPDGRWLAFDVSDPRESFTFEYASQTFTATGMPMWAGGSIFRSQLLDTVTGESIKLTSERGASWSGNWSPDGQSFAFYSDRDGTAKVWLWDRETRQVRKLSDAAVRMFRNNDRPQWTADGSRIVFKAVPEGMTYTDLARLDNNYRQKIEKSGASGRVNVFTTEKSAAEALPADWSAFMDYRFLADIVSVEVNSGRLQRVARNLRPLRFLISPNGKHVATINSDGRVPNMLLGTTSVRVYSLADGTEKVLADTVVPDDPAEFSWSPDSSRVAYVSRGGESMGTWSAYVSSIDGAAKTTLKLPAGQQLKGVRWGPMLWSADATRLYLLDTPQGMEAATERSCIWELPADGRVGKKLVTMADRRIADIVLPASRNTYWSDPSDSMILRTQAPQTKQQGFYRLNVRTGKTTRIAEYDAHLQHHLQGSISGPKQFAYFKEDAGHAPEIHLLDLKTGQSKQLSRLHAELASYAMGKTRLIEWQSLKGEALQGSLLLPADATPGKRLPLVVWVYGGKYGSNDLNRFAFGWGPTFNMQMFATRGYAVLYPDVPMHKGAPATDIFDAVIPGVNKAVELGFADPERLAVMGQSFGGYSTLALISRTQRFKAAVITGSGASNLFEGYSRFQNSLDSGIGYYERGQGAMYATPWEEPLRYLQNSPSFFFDQVQTALLIARGTEDPIAADSGAVFASLKRLGKMVELRDYEGEGHVLQRPDNVADLWQRRIEWIGRYLGAETH